MSTIAEEITALNTNLAAAKAAVTTAGGTVGDTGLAGLASEIATIPGGGPTPTPDPVSDYGVVRLYNYQVGYVNFEQMPDIMNPYALWIDQAQFASFCQTNNIDIPLDNEMNQYLQVSGTWPSQFNINWYPMEGEPYDGQWSSRTDFEAETGIYFVAPDGANVNAMIGKGSVINPSGATTDITLASQNDLNALCTTSYNVGGGGMGRGERILTINGNQVPAGAVKAFYFGTQNVAPNGAYFLAGCKNMTYVSTIPQRLGTAEGLFTECYSLKRLDFDEGAFNFRGYSLYELPSLEEIHVGDTTTITSTNASGQYMSGGTPVCATQLYDVASEGYLAPKTIRVFGGNRATILSTWGKSYYAQSYAYMRFLEDGGA